MQPYKSLSLVILVTTVISACGGSSVSPSSPTGALTANTTLNVAPQKPFDRQMLMVNGLLSLNEFIRSDVRSRVDEEAVGDSDPGYDSPDFGSSSQSVEPENPTDAKAQQSEEQPEQQQNGFDEDTSTAGASDTGKYLWAKKSFGEAVKSNPVAGGVIVLYADENFYDIGSLMRFIEEGRDRIVQGAEISGDRIQVVFGGYRGAPQVEYWIVPHGAPMPEFKTEDRTKATEPES
jgi:hypothetical protein